MAAKKPKSASKNKPSTSKSAAPKSKSAAKKPAAKSAVKASANKPRAARATPSTPVATKTARKSTPAKMSARRAPKKPLRRSADLHLLFRSLTEGESADALRLLLEDKRLANMAKVGRYRVIAVEPLVFKESHALGDHRVARVVIYDYSSNRCVEANVDLDTCAVVHLTLSLAQPALSVEEELASMSIALADPRVSSLLSLGEEPQCAMHYWSRRDADLAHTRRCAAVLFGQPHSRARVVALVDLLDGLVTEVVPAEQW